MIEQDNVVQALLQLAKVRYEKIIQMNLSTRKYKVIWSQNEDDLIKSGPPFDTHKFYAKDIKSFRRFRNAEVLKEELNGHTSISFRVRRKLEGKLFEWIQVEVVKTIDYSEDNVDIYLFIKNIEDSYGKEYNARKQAEQLAKTDALTGYYNRLAFNTFKKNADYKSIGIVYIDLNQLKAINDSQGHGAGDAYIQGCCMKINSMFPDYARYRVGGDEFIVVATNVKEEMFQSAVDLFMQSVDNDGVDIPICAVGCSWSNTKSFSLDELVRSAEHSMYKNKEQEYLKHHIDRRKG